MEESESKRFSKDPAKSEVPHSATEQTDYPSGISLAFLIASLLLALFLVALDGTIIATAIPSITDDFNSRSDVGWYGSAYLLTNCSFQLIFGRIYTFYSPKWVFFSAIGIFKVGSAICGDAQSSTAFIIGMAVAGSVASGIFNGGIIIIVHSVPLHKRPAYSGNFGVVFGLSSVLGPLLGGALTQHLSWRWCFLINLPTGAVAVVALLFILKLPSSLNRDNPPLKEQIRHLDPLGTFFFLPRSFACFWHCSGADQPTLGAMLELSSFRPLRHTNGMFYRRPNPQARHSNRAPSDPKAKLHASRNIPQLLQRALS